jgi:hypothetical protein
MSLIYPPLDEEQMRIICRDLMQEELFEGLVAKEELRLLRQGQTVLLPQDVDHARAMFKVASLYLSQNDKDFKLTME